MKILLGIIPFCLLASCSSIAPATNQKEDWQVKETRVISVTERPTVISGIIPTWVRVNIEIEENKKMNLYILFLDWEENLPTIGETCAFEGWEGKIDGIVSNGGNVPLQPVFAVNSFKCKKGPN